jgi:uncharacterized protein YjlB
MQVKRVNTNPHILHYRFSKNKNFPNNTLPVLIYKNALWLPRQKHRAADIVQQLMLKNNWKNSWRNGIYDFHHYHSNTHEGMIVTMGKALIMLGGPNGKKIKIQTGDVIILPAGTAHKCVSFSKDFMCVGAYPQGLQYDMNTGTAEELKMSMPRIRKCPIPKKDPVYGKEGFLKVYWK